MVTKLIQNEVAAECQRVATEAANEAIQHWIDGNKRQQDEDRRSILLSGILADERPGSPRPARQGSTKGNTQTGVKDKGDARRWVDLMREAEPTSSSYREQQGPEFPGLKEIRPINEIFKRALSYKTYRLRNRDDKYDGEVAQQLTKICRRAKHAMSGEEFTGQDEIAVLAF